MEDCYPHAMMYVTLKSHVVVDPVKSHLDQIDLRYVAMTPYEHHHQIYLLERISIYYG
jgi:hypothetical protein